MGYELGRLIDHVDIRSADYPRARAFYRAIMQALGRAGDARDGDEAFEIDELYVAPAGDGQPVGHVHLCFQTRDRAMVAAFHRAGIAAGGRDNGAPGLREYHPGYYAAFLLDPDGNNIEAKVDERVTGRSAASVRVTTS